MPQIEDNRLCSCNRNVENVLYKTAYCVNNKWRYYFYKHKIEVFVHNEKINKYKKLIN